jgi:transketolase
VTTPTTTTPVPQPATGTARDEQAVATIRTLAMDAVQAANSGHPGTPMAMAPVAYTLWSRHLRFDPGNPIWSNRDRFVLSAGHASTLLYALLHLAKVTAVNPMYELVGEPAVSLDDLRNFRQLDSRCPGHPEYRWTSGVECTTGPLGTGVATSVGMAIAGAWQAATFNRPGYQLFDFDVYALAGDGDMMEGIASEAASLAGHLKLDNLCWIYDSNRITIEGATSLAFSEDVATRFMGYGWNVTRVSDANDIEMLDRAFTVFRNEKTRPTLIIVDSHIGFGAPTKQGTAAAHGEPLGADEVRAAKRFYGWPEDAQFLVPDEVYQTFADGPGARGEHLRREWEALFGKYRQEYPELGAALDLMQRRQLPDGWDAEIPTFEPDAKGLAGREASGKVLNAIARRVPWLLGGACDLAPSTKTRLTFEAAGDFSFDNRAGRNLHFGVREHAAAAIVNGLSLSKIRPFQSGFLIFSDFQRGAVRLSAVMELPVLHIFTHDSIGVGEDGPTHQPVEHLASLRAIPNLDVVRPADANETAWAWRTVLEHTDRPAGLCLSRQNLPTFDRSPAGGFGAADGVARGAYVLQEADGGEPQIILVGTGSEVQIAVAAREVLQGEGIPTRVVSMPCWEWFFAQDQAYRDSVFPPSVRARVSVEAGVAQGWRAIVGDAGRCVSLEHFGASADYQKLYEEFGFTKEHVVAAAKESLAAAGV